MQLELIAVIVEDYDAAIAFYVGVLGFELVEDSPALTQRRSARSAGSSSARPARHDRPAARAQPTARAGRPRVGDQFAGRVGLFLRVDDFGVGYERMVAAGVRFDGEPRDEPYGRVVVFLDIAGNRWDLLGP